MIFWIIAILLLIFILVLYYTEGVRYIDLNTKNECNLLQLDRNYLKIPRVKINGKIMVSLTTIPDRINDLIPTLSSIYTQSLRVDEIRLNIPYESRKGIRYKIPNYLKKLKWLRIHRLLKDLGPSTKLLPTSRVEKHNTKIIVIDDDQIYGSEFVRSLTDVFKEKREKVAVTNYGSRIGDSSWDRVSSYASGGRYVDTLFGCGGYILTPVMLPKDVYNYSKGPKSAVFVDDNWISGWLKQNNVKIYMSGLKKGACFFLSSSTIGSTSLAGGENINKSHEKIVNKWFKNKELYSD